MNTSTKNPPIFKIWRTISFGPAVAMIGIMEHRDNNIRVSETAKKIFAEPGFVRSRGADSVSLVCPSIRELGFEKGARDSDFLKRAPELGLRLCEHDYGFRIRCDYLDQPAGEYLLVGMDLKTESGFVCFHAVENNETFGKSLGGYYGPSRFWYPHNRVIFVLP